MSDTYTMLAAHYNTVFPLFRSKEAVLRKYFYFNTSRAPLLNLGCATGELTGFPEPQNRCQTHRRRPQMPTCLPSPGNPEPTRFVRGYCRLPLGIPGNVRPWIICIGNTLPHLDPAAGDRFATPGAPPVAPQGAY